MNNEELINGFPRFEDNLKIRLKEDKEYAKYFLKTDPKGYYAIEYGNITNALIKYCQELRTRVDELERRLNNE